MEFSEDISCTDLCKRKLSLVMHIDNGDSDRLTFKISEQDDRVLVTFSQIIYCVPDRARNSFFHKRKIEAYCKRKTKGVEFPI